MCSAYWFGWCIGSLVGIVWGVVPILDMASFDLEDFLLNPSLDRLSACRKADLFAIAKHFDFEVPSSCVKSKLVELVMGLLVERGVLGEGAATAPIVPLSFETPKVVSEAEVKPSATLPRYASLSPSVSGSSIDARFRMRLARLQMEKEERQAQAQAEYAHRLDIRKMEIEAEKEVNIRKLELEAANVNLNLPTRSVSGSHGFDVSKHIALVPQFRESEVDSYFSAFERIAVSLGWPKEVWPLLLQCKLTGKAQEVVCFVLGG